MQWHSLDVRSGGNTLLMQAVDSSNGLALSWLVSSFAFALAKANVSLRFHLASSFDAGLLRACILHRSSKQDYDTSECVKSTKGLRSRVSGG